MRVSFSPMRRDDRLTVSKAGDMLIINGEQFDFAGLPDGATIPAGTVPCQWIAGPVERIAGELHLTLVLPHGSHPDEAVAHPEPVTVVPDGPIFLPEDQHVDF